MTATAADGGVAFVVDAVSCSDNEDLKLILKSEPTKPLVLCTILVSLQGLMTLALLVKACAFLWSILLLLLLFFALKSVPTIALESEEIPLLC